MQPSEPVQFVPLGVFAPTEDDSPAMLAASSDVPPSGPRRDDRVGLIEIELPAGSRIRVDAFVNEKALARVFRAMKGLM
jgi:transposase